MVQPLTPEIEIAFVNSFLAEDQVAARTLLEELKKISGASPVTVRLEASNVGAVGEKTYPRIHGRLMVGSEPILWSLCGRGNKPPRITSHQKVEVLASQTQALRAAGVLRQVEAIGRPVGLVLGSKKPGANFKISIRAAITAPRAEAIARAIAEIATVVLPVY